MTQTGSVLGTPLYLAPEQARGERHIDHRADIYAVGVLAYQMLSGQLPIQGDNLQNIIFRIATEPPVPLLHVIPDLPEGVARIVDSALAKDPAFRPPDAMAMLYALGIASGRSVRIARPVTQPAARFEDDSGVVDVRAAAVCARVHSAPDPENHDACGSRRPAISSRHMNPWRHRAILIPSLQHPSRTT